MELVNYVYVRRSYLSKHTGASRKEGGEGGDCITENILDMAPKGDLGSASCPNRFASDFKAPLPLNMRLGGPQNRSSYFGENKNILSHHFWRSVSQLQNFSDNFAIKFNQMV